MQCDVHTKEARSRNMAAIRGKNTRLEMTVRRGLHARGLRYSLHGKGLPGKVPGDLYAVLTIALPPSATAPEQEAWQALARAFATYNPRAALET